MALENKTMICRYLTNEGIQYLRDYLHLPSEIVPSTLKRALPRGDARPARTAAPRPGGDKPEGDRAAYRYTRLFQDSPCFDKSQIFHYCPCSGRHQEVRTRLEPPALALRPWSSVEVLAVASPPSRDNSVTFEKEKCFRANCHLLALCCTASDTKTVETSHVAELKVLVIEWKECSPGYSCLTAPRLRLPPVTSGQLSSNLVQ